MSRRAYPTEAFQAGQIHHPPAGGGFPPVPMAGPVAPVPGAFQPAGAPSLAPAPAQVPLFNPATMQGSGSVPYTPAPVTAPLYQPAGFGQPPATVPLYQPPEPFQQSAPKLGQITLASGNDVRPMAAPQVSAPELEGDEEDYRPRPSATPAISTKPPASGSGFNPPSLDQLRITEASSFSHVPPLSGTPPGAIPRMSVPPPTAEQLTQPAAPAPVHPAAGPSSVNQFNPPSGLQSQGFTDFEGGNAQPYGGPSLGANPYTPMVGSRPLPPAASSSAPQMNYSTAPTPAGVASPSFTGGFGADAVSLTPRDEWQAPDEFLAPTLRFVPQTDSLLETSGLPFGVVIRPLSPVGRTEPAVHPIQEGQATVPIPVIDYRGGSSIIRCRRCRCYMNPFATFSDGGKRWKCNLCYLLDDVPTEYFSMLNAEGMRYDHAERKELNNGVVEFIASGEYMTRPPQAPAYFFVIDVTYAAVASGMVNSALAAIRRSLDHLSQSPRTQVGFMTVSDTMHFYNLRSSLKQPQMMVVPEVDRPFCPLPFDLLVNLRDSRHLIDKLVGELLPAMYGDLSSFQNSAGGPEGAAGAAASVLGSRNALGPALTAAYEVMKGGGKILLFQSSLPNVGVGSLKNREAPSLMGTDKERPLLLPSENFYKGFALECNKRYICVDMYLFTPRYIDVATLAEMSHLTGGECKHYLLGQDSAQAGRALYEDVYDNLTREQGFEGIIRFRCSKGVTMTSFHGNFFVRNKDLLSVSTIDSQKSITVRLKIDEPKEVFSTKNLAKDGHHYIGVQVALLYTTFLGERRIRTITKALRVTNLLQELYQSASLANCINLMSKLAVAKALEAGVPKARDALRDSCLNVLTKYQEAFVNGRELMIPDTLKLLPIMTLAMVKHDIFRAGNDVNLDLRTHGMHKLRVMDAQESWAQFYPRLFNLVLLTQESGLPGPNGKIVLPPTLELSSEKLDRQGVFLMENGENIWIWIGSMVNPQFLQMVFDIQSLAQVDPSNSQLRLVRMDNDLSIRINNIVQAIRLERAKPMPLHVLKERDFGEYKFFSQLVHDRSKHAHSYIDFVRELQRIVLSKVTKK